MEPTTMMLVSTAFSAVSSLMKGSAQSSAATYNANIARQNAQIATDQGAAQAAAHDKSARIQIGQMIANYGAAGVSSGQGSALDVLQDSVRTAKLDNLTILNNAQLRANSYLNSAALDDSQASSATRPDCWAPRVRPRAVTGNTTR